MHVMSSYSSLPSGVILAILWCIINSLDSSSAFNHIYFFFSLKDISRLPRAVIVISSSQVRSLIKLSLTIVSSAFSVCKW